MVRTWSAPPQGGAIATGSYPIDVSLLLTIAYSNDDGIVTMVA